MILENNTILITGGSSGIGLELAKRLSQLNNTVIICGRTQQKLEQAADQIPGLHTFGCDISESDECKALAKWIEKNHPAFNVLINNAAIVHKTSFHEDPLMIEKAQLEIDTNLVGPIVLTKALLPILMDNKRAKVVNITTGLIYAPRGVYPIYNATKSGLHAFTQTMRLQLISQPIQVIEIMYPVVNTPWHQGGVPNIAIDVEQAVDETLSGLTKGRDEIKVGKVKILYALHRLFPRIAMKLINRV